VDEYYILLIQFNIYIMHHNIGYITCCDAGNLNMMRAGGKSARSQDLKNLM